MRLYSWTTLRQKTREKGSVRKSSNQDSAMRMWGTNRPTNEGGAWSFCPRKRRISELRRLNDDASRSDDQTTSGAVGGAHTDLSPRRIVFIRMIFTEFLPIAARTLARLLTGGNPSCTATPATQRRSLATNEPKSTTRLVRPASKTHSFTRRLAFHA